MASPITQPKNRLFRRAILLDGTALSPWAMASGSETATFLDLAEELKVGSFNVDALGTMMLAFSALMARSRRTVGLERRYSSGRAHRFFAASRSTVSTI